MKVSWISNQETPSEMLNRSSQLSFDVLRITRSSLRAPERHPRQHLSLQSLFASLYS